MQDRPWCHYNPPRQGTDIGVVHLLSFPSVCLQASWCRSITMWPRRISSWRGAAQGASPGSPHQRAPPTEFSCGGSRCTSSLSFSVSSLSVSCLCTCTCMLCFGLSTACFCFVVVVVMVIGCCYFCCVEKRGGTRIQPCFAPYLTGMGPDVSMFSDHF